jgi:hypothetical protein
MKKLLSALLIGLAFSAPTHADLTHGLMAYYKFDDCSAGDASGNSNNGVLNGKIACIDDGVINKALRFDGATGYINVPNSRTLNPARQLTLSFWLRVDGISAAWSPLIHKGGLALPSSANRTYSVWLSDTPTLYLAAAGVQDEQHALNSQKIVKGKWLHYVGIIDRINHIDKIYINGVLSAQSLDSYSAFNKNNADLRIAWSEEAAADYAPFKGALDEIRLYNRALSDADIQNLYTQGFPISGNLKGLSSVQSVSCKNDSTGQIVNFNASNAQTYDCEKAGLTIKSNQDVTITIKGKAL